MLWINAIKEAGNNLAVWKYSSNSMRFTSIKSLERVIHNKIQWTASDCSDIIRLFGGIIEDTTLQSRGLVDRGVDDFRGRQRPGRGYDTKGPDAQRVGSRKGHYPEGVQATRLPHTDSAHHAILDFKRQPGFSGIANTTILDASTVKKIDSTFGLAEGCDISGTTADSIFFMKHVQSFINGLPEGIPNHILPVIQLLPLATMASQGHHTILECALTLTLNRITAYRIGFYSTLRPLHVALPGELTNVFNAAEQDIRNKHIICYWEDGKLQGIHYNKQDEIDQLKKVCLANDAFRGQFHHLPLKPTADRLFSLPSLHDFPH